MSTKSVFTKSLKHPKPTRIRLEHDSITLETSGGFWAYTDADGRCRRVAVPYTTPGFIRRVIIGWLFGWEWVVPQNYKTGLDGRLSYLYSQLSSY